MDIEKLTKAQTVLLTLLVSFVTSIATGIVTVTLMDQAPPAITQTIQRVVTKTIETVAPENTQTASAKNDIVVVKEQNSVADVVDKMKEIFVRIVNKTESGEIFVGFGFFVDKSGILVTDSSNLVEGGNYAVYIEDKKIDLQKISINESKHVAYLKVVQNDSQIFKTFFKEANIASSDSLKLGQSIVVLGGIESTEVFTGIVSGFVRDSVSDNTASTTSEIKDLVTLAIKTNISPTSVFGGAPMLNLKGEVVGINVETGTNSFIPIDFVSFDIKNILSQDPPKKVD
ncbi:MAG: S1C family serine protease [Candidatus Pacebacteria bacterium]|nr:S1C family serine protease [Candidatus Paceibacterota bacterium]